MWYVVEQIFTLEDQSWAFHVTLSPVIAVWKHSICVMIPICVIGQHQYAHKRCNAEEQRGRDKSIKKLMILSNSHKGFTFSNCCIKHLLVFLFWVVDMIRIFIIQPTLRSPISSSVQQQTENALAFITETYANCQLNCLCKGWDDVVSGNGESFTCNRLPYGLWSN